MLCSLEYGTYIFFAFWVVLMTLYVIFFLPETKGVPVEEMGFIWRRHWFWRKVIMTPAERAAFESGDVVATGMTAKEVEVSLRLCLTSRAWVTSFIQNMEDCAVLQITLTNM